MNDSSGRASGIKRVSDDYPRDLFVPALRTQARRLAGWLGRSPRRAVAIGVGGLLLIFFLLSYLTAGRSVGHRIAQALVTDAALLLVMAIVVPLLRVRRLRFLAIGLAYCCPNLLFPAAYAWLDHRTVLLTLQERLVVIWPAALIYGVTFFLIERHQQKG